MESIWDAMTPPLRSDDIVKLALGPKEAKDLTFSPGLSSEDAGVAAGVSPAVGTRWFRDNGGMPSSNLTPLSGRYLSFGELGDYTRRHHCW